MACGDMTQQPAGLQGTTEGTAEWQPAANWLSDLEREGQADGIEPQRLHAQENGGHIQRAAVRARPQAIHNGIPCV